MPGERTVPVTVRLTPGQILELQRETRALGGVATQSAIARKCVELGLQQMRRQRRARTDERRSS